jgi:hypothetical protein
MNILNLRFFAKLAFSAALAGFTGGYVYTFIAGF